MGAQMEIVYVKPQAAADSGADQVKPAHHNNNTRLQRPEHGDGNLALRLLLYLNL